MSDEKQLEVLPARRADGTLLPGQPSLGGRKSGSMNRVTAFMKSELARHLEDVGEKANPLMVLASIYENEDNPAMIRARAADMLLRYLAPRLLQIEVDQPDQTVETHITSLKTTLRGLLKKE